MRTCPKCKTEYPDDKKYCKTCGAQLLSNKEVDPKFSARKMVIEEKIRTDPLNISLLNQFAELLIENHLYDEAILNLYKVLAIEEGNLKAQRYLFHCLNATDKTKEAAEIGYKLVDLIPGNTDLLLEIALLSMGQGDNSRAVDYFDRIIKNDPKRKDAWKYKAVVLDKMGDKESSFKAWNIVYSIDSNDTDAKLYLGIEAAKNGEYVKAKEFIEFFIKKIDDKTQKRFLGLVYLAKSYLNLNIDENSIRNLYSEIISISQPDWLDEEVKLILSEIAFSLGQKALEREDYNNALSYFENIKEYGNAKKSKEACALTYYKMSEEYLNKKEYENAEYYMNESLKLDPANEEVKGKHSEISNKINIAKKKKRKSNIIIFSIVLVIILAAVFTIRTIQSQNENKAWDTAKKGNTETAYQKYLDEYPNGKYGIEALNSKEDASWNEAKKINTLQSYSDYILSYPSGKYIKDAISNKEKISFFIDKRDGKKYRIVLIGKQIWTAENLNFDIKTGSWFYKNDPNNGKKYGRLYNWETAMLVCPKGWHLPSVAEWKELIQYLGGGDLAGGKMKTIGTSDWQSQNVGADNSSGFSAIPGGICIYPDSFKMFEGLGEEATFWSSTPDPGGLQANYFCLLNRNTGITWGINPKDVAYSIRCIKD